MFLLAKYYLRPRHPNRTATKDYWKHDDAGQLDEQVSFSRKLRDKDVQNYNVILDLDNKKIVKCVIDQFNGTDYDRMFEYFKRNYPQHLAAVTTNPSVTPDEVVPLEQQV